MNWNPFSPTPGFHVRSPSLLGAVPVGSRNIEFTANMVITPCGVDSGDLSNSTVTIKSLGRVYAISTTRGPEGNVTTICLQRDPRLEKGTISTFEWSPKFETINLGGPALSRRENKITDMVVGGERYIWRQQDDGSFECRNGGEMFLTASRDRCINVSIRTPNDLGREVTAYFAVAAMVLFCSTGK